MNKKNLVWVVIAVAFGVGACSHKTANVTENDTYYKEKHRPQFHFSPEKMWTNDPNGLVYFDGEYHLFYQYYPDSTVWGPMHWGHAVSNDLFHWKHLPVALYPDSLGYIFSGSCVIDTANTSGLGEPGKPAMVAIFTYHNPVLEKKGGKNHQYQGLAYSTDKGRSWTKYSKNPVIPNPGLNDFRDPSVSWNSAEGKWILTLAAGDHIMFYSSANLLEWKLESEFGKDKGAHGGVWECPSLTEMDVENEPGVKKWMLLVSINPGGPLGGSATQYFTGTFDGHTFKSETDKIRWVDYGPDNYAGITFSNTGKRKIFLGWMNNWNYANRVPTSPWRGQMTIPRELSLVKKSGQYQLLNFPVKELDSITSPSRIDPKGNDGVYELNSKVTAQLRLDLSIPAEALNTAIEFSNDLGERLKFAFDRKSNLITCDRSGSGIVDFSKDFTAPAIVAHVSDIKGERKLTLIIDRCSAELFADNGLSVLTVLFFPKNHFISMKVVTSPSTATTADISLRSVETVWEKADPGNNN